MLLSLDTSVATYLFSIVLLLPTLVLLTVFSFFRLQHKSLTQHTTQLESERKQQKESFGIFCGRCANSNKHEKALVSQVNIFVDVSLTNNKFSQHYFGFFVPTGTCIGGPIFLWFKVLVQARLSDNASKHNLRSFPGWFSIMRAFDTILFGHVYRRNPQWKTSFLCSAPCQIKCSKEVFKISLMARKLIEKSSSRGKLFKKFKKTRSNIDRELYKKY